jgi:hypothetical protein
MAKNALPAEEREALTIARLPERPPPRVTAVTWCLSVIQLVEV